MSQASTINHVALREPQCGTLRQAQCITLREAQGTSFRQAQQRGYLFELNAPRAVSLSTIMTWAPA